MLNLNMTNTQLLDMNPQELVAWLQMEYVKEIPTDVNSPEEVNKAALMLGELVNAYSYLTVMLSYAKLQVRQLKQNKADKKDIDTAIDRKDIFESFSNIAKMQYTAASRIISARKQMEDEARATM